LPKKRRIVTWVTMRFTILSLLLVLSARPASADSWVNPYTGGVWNNPVSSYVDTAMHNQMMEKMWQRWYGGRQKAGTAASPSTPDRPISHQPYTKTDFTPGKQRLVVDAIIAGLAQNAQQRQGLQQGVAMVFEQYEKTVRKNNVAYALAFVIGASLQVQTGEQIPDAQAEQLAQALNDALASNPGFAKMRATDRQKLYEACVTLGGLVMLFAEVGKHDPASAKAAKLLATQSLAMLGFKA
ncbi:MAG: DUF6683 family protein, partial [Acidobacteriota bacterium]